MHAPTFNKWHKKNKKNKNKNKKVTLHILTHGAMQGCGLTSLMACINDKICDIEERNKEWNLNYKRPLPRVWGYWRVSDIMRVEIMEFSV